MLFRMMMCVRMVAREFLLAVVFVVLLASAADVLDVAVISAERFMTAVRSYSLLRLEAMERMLRLARLEPRCSSC